MKRIYWLLPLLFCFVQCKAPKNGESVRAKPKRFAKMIKAKNLKEKLYVFASDDFEGRETGERGQKKAADYLKNFYREHDISAPDQKEGYYQTISSSFFNHKIKDSENVMAVIKGSEFPNEIVVVSAHYDHLGIDSRGQIYNGADDDGSGTIAVLEMAKAFKKAKTKGKGPRRTILFLHFTGEEKGLLGSKYYTEHPVFPLKNTVVNLNTDMIGRVDQFHKETAEYIYLIGSNRLSSELDSIIVQENEKYTHLDLDYKYNDPKDPQRLYYRSDHYNFAKHNIPVNFFFSGLHEDYHKPGDTPDKINYQIYEKRARLIFYTAWEVANRAKRLEVDKK